LASDLDFFSGTGFCGVVSVFGLMMRILLFFLTRLALCPEEA
jgi:hypothetical protein